MTRVPGHTGRLGNEQVDRLARQACSQAFVGPEPALPISHTVVKTAIRDWVYKQSDKCWQSLTTCQQAKEMITGRCRRRETDLQALTGQMLRPVIGILTGHTQVQRHLSLMGPSNDPFCSYCKEAVESASHFLCHCNHFTTLERQCGENLVYKPYRYPATVGDIVRFIKKSHRFSSSIQ